MHRTYVHDGTIWILASVYAKLGPLPREAERYVVYETLRPPSVEEVCLVTDDGRRLCDVGAQHAHTDDGEIDDIGRRDAQRRAMRGH